MDFGELPPEINSIKMYLGAGSGPMLAAAAAWDELVDKLYATATSFRSVMAGLTSEQWKGPAASLMSDAATPYVTWLAGTAERARQAGGHAKAAVAAYEAARAMTVPPAVVMANRNVFRALVATNFVSQNTPGIAKIEADYNEMWAQDAAAMYSYADSSATACQLTLFTPPPAELLVLAALAGRAACASEITTTESVSSIQSQGLSAAPSALQRLHSPPPPASPSEPLIATDDPPQTDSDTNTSDWDSALSAIQSLTAPPRPKREKCSADSIVRQRGQPVAMRAWFGGNRAAWKVRQGSHFRGPAEAAANHNIGPATRIGELSVPQTWVAATRVQPAGVAPGPRGTARHASTSGTNSGPAVQPC